MSATVQEVNLNPKGSFTPIKLPDCYTKIAELAFYTSESRALKPGHKLDNRIEAEREFEGITAKNIHHKSHIM